MKTPLSEFLSMGLGRAFTSRDHFFPFFRLQTFMNSGMATMAVCLLQKLSDDGLRYYWDALPLQCTTRVSDGFALVLGDRNRFRPCLIHFARLLQCKLEIVNQTSPKPY